MSDLPRYCLLENSEAWSVPLVLDLQTYIVAVPSAVDYRDAGRIASSMDDLANERLPMAKVPGHTIFLYPKYVFTDRRYTPAEMREALRGMARFYADYKIAKHPARYARNRDGYRPEENGEWRPLSAGRLAAKKVNE